MDRRGFLGSILAACAAPAIVRADSLMRIVPVETVILPGDVWDIPPLDPSAYDVIIETWPSYNAITREALRIAHDKAAFIHGFNEAYCRAFSKQGDTIKLPNAYTRLRA